MANNPGEIASLSLTEKRTLLARLLQQKAALGEQPLSVGQKALWFLHRMAPESTAYHINFAARLVGVLDIGALRTAFARVADWHPVLRSRFDSSRGEPVQMMGAGVEVALAVEDASDWSEAELAQRLDSEAHRPFDLETGPLLRGWLFVRSAEEHVLLLSMHHIVSDFWTLVILLEDLRRAYLGAAAGHHLEAGPVSGTYTDFATWQENLATDAQGERLWHYWREQLAGCSPMLDLPVDRPRPPVQANRGGAYQFMLDESLTSSLKALASREGSSMYMVLLALFQALLYRCSGQSDLTVGSPTSARVRPEWMGLAGYFVNPVVLRATVASEHTFRSFLRQVRNTVLDALEHKDYPFPYLAQRLDGARDLSRSPLFQAEFSFYAPQNLSWAGASLFMLGVPGGRLTWDQLTLESLELPQRIAPMDLSLRTEEVNGNIFATMLYDTALFDRESVVRMADQFRNLAQAVAAEPDQLVDKLPLLSVAERERLLAQWNPPEVGQASPLCFTRTFERLARCSPHAPAVVYGRTEMTYGELNARANQLAHLLITLGVGPEVVVGLCLDRSPELLVGFLAILKAGGAYLPLPPQFPDRRLAVMAQDAGAALILSEERLAGRLLDAGVKVVCLDSQRTAMERMSVTDPDVRVVPAQLAYVIYTSGSTGTPKGVLVEHQGMANMAHEQRKIMGVGAGKRVLQAAALSFDASIAEFTTALGSGAALVLPDTDGPGAIPDVIRRHGVTHCTLTPSVLSILREADLPTLEVIMAAGEACPSLIAERWRKGRRMLNLYGPTEASCWATYAVLDGAVPPPIGKAIGGQRVYVLDRYLQPVPVGVPGELYIGGVGVARGYAGPPEITAERFLPDPFSSAPGSRVYRTGDRVRYRADGNLEFLGRVDEQVKVRGVRLELTEIEAVLNQSPLVRECAVAAVGETGARRLVAFLVPADGTPPLDDLRRYMSERLPAYACPSAFMVVPSIPTTASGKVDRRSLLTCKGVMLGAEATGAELRTPAQEHVARIFRELLSLDLVGLHDNFFDLGGNSLLVFRLQHRLRELAPQEVPMVELFRHPTVDALARYLAQGEPQNAEVQIGQRRGQARRNAQLGVAP